MATTDHAPLIPLRTAVLSASDKTGLAEFARQLGDRGVQLISTGGTARALRDAGLKVTNVEDITGFPEMMDGRVKTLHPKIHGGLLALRDKPEHTEALKQHHITPIDLVCVNLYPFERTVADPDVAYAQAVENIDIGGPCMIRAAAKNHRFVACVTSPDQYTQVLGDLDGHDGHTRYATRQRLAAAAYARTAEYDAAIATWLTDQL